jgi:23S rRNA-/tRNA-specific pseudouridylate synthase
MFQPAEYEPGFVKETKVLRDDGDTIVFHKPGNLVVHATGLYGRNTFLDVLEELGHHNVFPVHRIDRETSGILLCAREPATRRILAEQFRDEGMQKMYIAFAKSFVNVPQEFVIDAPIGPAAALMSSKIRLKMWVGDSNESARARTRFVRIAQIDSNALFLCFPETGRTNQIRVHLAAAGQWIFGDKMYHPDENVFLSYFDNGLTQEILECIEIPRHALHNCIIYGNKETAHIFKDGPVVCPVSADLIEFRLFRDLLEEARVGISESNQSAEFLRLFLKHSKSEASTDTHVPVFGLAELNDLFFRASSHFPVLGQPAHAFEGQRGSP